MRPVHRDSVASWYPAEHVFFLSSDITFSGVLFLVFCVPMHQYFLLSTLVTISQRVNSYQGRLGLSHQSSIINHQSSIINHQSSIINHQSSTINHQPSITNHQSPIINHQSSIINHQSSIINHQSSIINHQSSIINHQSSIINHQSSIINHQSSMGWRGGWRHAQETEVWVWPSSS